MNKIFAPMSRWHFIVCVFFLYILTSLLTSYGLFLPYSFVYIAYLMPFIFFYIVLKRFLDICDKPWKAAVWSIVLFGIVMSVYFISLYVFFNTPISENIKHFMKILPIYEILRDILLVFLAVKKGKSSEGVKFEIKTVLKRTCIIGFIFFVFLLFITNFYTATPGVSSHRMYPSIEEIDYAIAQRITKLNPIKRGDIVSLKTNNPYILRVIGMPNETIELKGKEIYIDGKLYDDKYAFFSKNLEPINFNEKIKLDNDSYFVIGDNRYYDIKGKMWRKVGSKKKNNVHYEWKPLKKIITEWRGDKGKIFATVKKNEISGNIVAVKYEIPNKKKNKKIKCAYKFSFIKNEFNFKEKTVFRKMFGREE